MNLLPRPEAPGPSTGAAVDLPAGLAWPGHEQGRPATLMAALARNALLHANEVAVRERDHGIWQEWTWRNLLTDVLALAAALERRGVGAGSAVTSIGDNRYRIYASMLGVMTLRAFPVPVFPDVPPAELEHYTRHGAPDVAIAEDQEQVDKLLDLRERIGRPSLIVYDDARGLAPYRASGLLSCDELLREGRQRLAAEPDLAADLVCRAQAADLAVLLHSSGTTGQPKGVPLTHDNVVQGVTNALNGGYFQGARGALRLSAHRLGRRLRLHAGGRRAAALRRSTSPSARRLFCTTCARSRPRCTWPRRAPGTTCSRASRWACRSPHR